MDTIFIRGIAVEAIIGIYEHERTRKQRVVVDLELATDIGPAAKSEKIEDALDYEALTNSVEAFLRHSEYQLIETLAEDLAQHILATPAVASLKLTLHKPDALQNAADVGLIIQRSR